MKTKFLKLSNPCTENWEKMSPRGDGNFCEVCAKTVIDFTQMNQYEIATKLKEAGGNLCGRVTQKQLNLPLPDLGTHKEFDLPYSNIAAGLLIASTLVTAQPLQAENRSEKIEFVQLSGSKPQKETINRKPSSNIPKLNDIVIFKGKVQYEKNAMPLENAKITFVTVKKIIVVYTLPDGTFSMNIPSDFIDNDNVIKVSYDKVKIEKTNKRFYGYEEKDYILSKDEILAGYTVIAEEPFMTLGGMRSLLREEEIPVYVYNGKEINSKEFYKEYYKVRENKTYMYFEHGTAIAIYGQKAQYGLHILIDK